MFIDKSVVNKWILDHKYEWSYIDIQYIITKEFKRSKKWNILFIYIQDKYITWNIIHKSYIIELFNQFIEIWIISNINPFSNFNSILIMNNIKIYHNEIRFIFIIIIYNINY